MALAKLYMCSDFRIQVESDGDRAFETDKIPRVRDEEVRKRGMERGSRVLVHPCFVRVSGVYRTCSGITRQKGRYQADLEIPHVVILNGKMSD